MNLQSNYKSINPDAWDGNTLYFADDSDRVVHRICLPNPTDKRIARCRSVIRCLHAYGGALIIWTQKALTRVGGWSIPTVDPDLRRISFYEDKICIRYRDSIAFLNWNTGAVDATIKAPGLKEYTQFFATEHGLLVSDVQNLQGMIQYGSKEHDYFPVGYTYNHRMGHLYRARWGGTTLSPRRPHLPWHGCETSLEFRIYGWDGMSPLGRFQASIDGIRDHRWQERRFDFNFALAPALTRLPTELCGMIKALALPMARGIFIPEVAG